MAYQALYRAFRPERFADIVGQEPIVTTLKNQIKSGRIAHAYLFCGSRGTGKTTTARVFARAINCLTPEDGCEPCGKCAVCREFLEERSMDLIEIDAASNTGVDEIRALRDKVKYPPATARHKVYIIDEVHMLSTGAFNALLKTLEEPPEHAVFLLATTEPNRLPATILSRCQRFDVKRYSAPVIIAQLRKVLAGVGAEAEDEALAEIARAAEGCMRDALSILDLCLSYGADRVTAAAVREALGTTGRGFLFDFADKLLSDDAAGALRCIDEAMRDGRDPQALAREVTGHMRALLVAQALEKEGASAVAELLECTPEDAARYREQSKRAAGEKLTRMMDSFMRCEGDMKWASQPRTALELCAFLACRPEQELQLNALAERVARLEQQVKNGLRVAMPTSAEAAPPPEDVPPFDLGPDAPPPAAPEEPAAEKSAPRKKAEPPKAAAEGQDKWEAALAALGQENRALQMPLTKAVYRGVEGGALVLEFAKNDAMFLKILDNDAKKGAIAAAAGKAFGQDLAVILRMQGAGPGPAADRAADPERTQTILHAREIFGRENVDILDE